MSTTEQERRSLLKVPEVAEQLGVSIGHVYRLVYRGDIPAIKLGDNKFAPLRIEPDALDAWLRRPIRPVSSGQGASTPSGSRSPEGGEGS